MNNIDYLFTMTRAKEKDILSVNVIVSVRI